MKMDNRPARILPLEYLPALIVFALLMSFAGRADAQQDPLFGFKAAAFEVSWYEPALQFYQMNEDYLLDFSGDVLFEGHIEFSFLRFLTLRGSIGYWSREKEADIGVGDPENARRHEATLDIVPLSGALYHEARWLTILGIRPVIGGGVMQNLVQRTFYRARLDGTTSPEVFVGNGRDVAYFGMAGVHFPLAEPVWGGLEVRLVRGQFEEFQPADAPVQAVSLDGFVYGASLRYRLP